MGDKNKKRKYFMVFNEGNNEKCFGNIQWCEIKKYVYE